ncbi:MAG: peptidoglycan editing factor PgeF [Pseudomonadota bacterium]
MKSESPIGIGNAMIEVAPLQSGLLSHQAVKHGFFSRRKGVSKGIYESLNAGLGSDDSREHVLQNRARISGFFNKEPDFLVTPYQVHSAEALQVTTPWDADTRPKVDALVTRNPDIVIGILTADCGPVLFADPENGVVAAAHAGWKGATGGVLENTISAMVEAGAKRSSITAVLGPTISQKNYEVGPEFVERLVALSAGNNDYFIASENPGHAMFDLPGYIVDRLENADVKADWTGHCTYEEEDNFFSYRRTTHRSEPDYGRQISAISIRDIS